MLKNFPIVPLHCPFFLIEGLNPFLGDLQGLRENSSGLLWERLMTLLFAVLHFDRKHFMLHVLHEKKLQIKWIRICGKEEIGIRLKITRSELFPWFLMSKVFLRNLEWMKAYIYVYKFLYSIKQTQLL